MGDKTKLPFLNRTSCIQKFLNTKKTDVKEG